MFYSTDKIINYIQIIENKSQFIYQNMPLNSYRINIMNNSKIFSELELIPTNDILIQYASYNFESVSVYSLKNLKSM